MAGNIIKFERASREEVQKLYEARREAFFEEYGYTPSEGESEEIGLFRKWFQTDTLAAVKGCLRENIPAANNEETDSFTRRREAAEYARFICILDELDRLKSRKERDAEIEQMERYNICEKKLQELEARGEDTSCCYFLDSEKTKEVEQAFDKLMKGKN